MGLLTKGSPLPWSQIEGEVADYIRLHGVYQFINQYKKLESRTNDTLKWGDEVEYILVVFDHVNKKVRLRLRATEMLETLQVDEKNDPESCRELWRPEYAEYMIEGTPGQPYGDLFACFNNVEANMRARRESVSRLCAENESCLSLTVFPRMGCPGFTWPEFAPNPTDGASRSLFFPDQAITQGHPRFSTLTRNIRSRRGRKVQINLPIYKDANTPEVFREDFSVLGDDGEAKEAAKDDHVYMDAMGFGMGNSCLQMTFQACNICEARILYDQLAPLCPILLALSAASPVYRGYLVDVDCRWNVISGAVDCRTKEEMGLEPLNKSRFVIPKSRYATISSYLSRCGCAYNDVPLVKDENYEKILLEAGIDKLLASHIAHLFIRDPVSVFAENIELDDERDTDHFENIQSTNWQSMRFKPPPPDSQIGWRVEFRPTELQLTDFENAAYATFIVLLTRVILSFQLNFIIPISKVDENMETAQKRDAVNQDLFYFRKDIVTCQTPSVATETCKSFKCDPNRCKEGEYQLMSVDTIINGKDEVFPGLIPLMREYISNIDADVDTQCTISQYLSFIQKRASGEIQTFAGWCRSFVTSHPAYNKDSVVNEEVTYDLLLKCDRITKGKELCPELTGEYTTRTNEVIPTALTKAQQKMNRNGPTKSSKKL